MKFPEDYKPTRANGAAEYLPKSLKDYVTKLDTVKNSSILSWLAQETDSKFNKQSLYKENY